MSANERFQKFVGDFGNYSWVVLFAEAPIESVTDAYATISGRSASSDIAVSSDTSHLNPPSGCVVQVSDSNWIIVFHLVGQWGEFNASSLSKRLKARVLEFSGEDTSGAVEGRLHEPDGGIVRYQVSRDATAEDELYDEMSDYAEEMGIDLARPDVATEIESYSSLFDALGIRPIEISLTSERTVIVDQADSRRIVRVDAIET